MNLIKTSIQRPIAVLSAVLMTIMFGLVALERIPIQLIPDVNRPVITITTSWPGAAPAEIEREIVNRQEEALKGITGLESIESSSQQGRGRITLEFAIDTQMDRSLLLVSNRLDRVSGYPEEADEPSLSAAGAEDSPIAWFVLTRAEGNTKPIHEYGDFVNDIIKERIERVKGVGEVNVYGGSEREIQVIVDPENLASYGFTINNVVSSLRAANASVSAGDVDEGKRRYVVRAEGEINTVQSIKDVVLRSDKNDTTNAVARVRVSDVAEVQFAYKDPVAKIRLLSNAAMAFNATRETKANVIETMDGIKRAAKELEEGAIKNAGLKLRHVYDETVYINSAIDLVQQNIWVGGVLAAIILLLFLRSPRATLVVSLAIPVSVIGSFVAMSFLGRSINVISLAGIAFAVGMVVDAAIVVLENIYRLREKGRPPKEAAYKGALQVWGAVLVSALTTVMVFIPILIMDLEVGQLFRDIAVAISVSVILSLIVSVTVLPSLASKLLVKIKAKSSKKGKSQSAFYLPVIDELAQGFSAFFLGLVRGINATRFTALTVVVGMTVLASICAWIFLPKLEYLPEGNRNLMFGIVLPPPGYNLDTVTDIAKKIEDETRPLWADLHGKEEVAGGPPKIDRFFFVARRSSTFLGAAAVDPSRVAELAPILRKPVYSEPGTFAIIKQSSLFGRSLSGGRKIELDIQGPDLETILNVAGQATGQVLKNFPRKEGNQFRPKPGLELGAPEVRVIPDRLKLADNGVSMRDLGSAIDAFNDGLRVAEVTVGSDRLDLMLKGRDGKVSTTQGVGQLPVVTSDGRILPVSSLSQVNLTAGPTEIRHRDRVRTVTLDIVPSPKVPLEKALDLLKAEVMKPMQDKGLPDGVQMRLSGTADKLSVTWNTMVSDLIISLIIVYLVMAVLFESFIYPFIILLSVPLAAAGGVGGLAILNTFVYQPLDMLTLLGFVILVGIVVNNAILLVHQTLAHIREDGMTSKDAIMEATRNRMRPIFMSTLTSVVGMLPLVVFPGAGSELYRGLGSVVVGGLSLSAILTLIIIPAMLTVTVGTLERGTSKPPKKAKA